MTIELARKPASASNNGEIDYADSQATRLGFKTYSHGTNYNGNSSPTITQSGGTGTLNAVNIGDFIPYQMQDGTWRCKFNITVTMSSASRNSLVLNVVGITFFTTSGGSDGQTIAGGVAQATNVGASYAQANTGNITNVSSTLTTTEYWFSGDVRLNSKPTWAY